MFVLLVLAAVRPSVLVTDGLAPAAISLLTDGGADVVQHHLSIDELACGGLGKHDAVIIRSATQLTADAIAAGASGGKLRVIGRAGVGVDNIDLSSARNAGCWVLNTPGASTTSVVELLLAHMLATARGLQVAETGLRSGKWLKGKMSLGGKGGSSLGHELAGKRLGLLGFGRIAQSAAGAASALGMQVMAYSRSAETASAAALGVELASSSAELFASCTHVAVLCSLSDETRGLVDRGVIESMPTVGADGTPCGSHLFNLARGGIVVEEDAAGALEDGTLGSYSADVFEVEPPPASNPLLSCEHFHGTPHVGGATLEAQARVGTLIAENVLRALAGELGGAEDCVVATGRSPREQ